MISSHLYQSDLSHFVPVLLEGGKRDYISESIRGAAHYFVDKPQGYEGLLRRLFNRTMEVLLIGKQPVLTLSPKSPLAIGERPVLHVHFTAYHPNEIKPQIWYTLLSMYIFRRRCSRRWKRTQSSVSRFRMAVESA